MRLEAQIAAAYGLDLLCGDPRWLPHPVKLIGRLAIFLEVPLRRLIANARLAGVAAVVLVVGATAAVAGATITAAYRMHLWVGDVVSITLLYTAFATRDLAAHATAVHSALAQGDLPLARTRVSCIVGRDTACLDEPGIVRAAVESVAENTVDGVTAPLFFAALGGPVLALAYKAVSTLDSTFGYKNQRYLDFGWASARFDDLAAWLPSRLTFPLIVFAAAITGMHPVGAWKLGLRDGHKHASPNAGLAEAAAAGALGVQLGGPLSRNGQVVELPHMGKPTETLNRRHIRRAIKLMLVTSLLAVTLFLAVRAAIEGFI